MDLTTKYLGLELAHPIVPGASPLVDDMDKVLDLEDAGAPAIIMHSLFEEQIKREELGVTDGTSEFEHSFAEASSVLPEPKDFRLGPDEYLRQIQRIKKRTNLPIIASLNARSTGSWLEYARCIEEAGANALELNLYYLATDPDVRGQTIENEAIDMVKVLKADLGIPLAVKLSPFYTALSNFAQRLTEAGADGLVLFNRFYQSDIDVEALEVVPRLELSTSAELLLRIRWLAILSGKIKASLAASGGVHIPEDAIKALMAGADVVQVVSLLLQRGPASLRELHEGVGWWLEQFEYESIDQLRGSMNLERCPDPSAHERVNYMRVLKSWEGPGFTPRF